MILDVGVVTHVCVEGDGVTVGVGVVAPVAVVLIPPESMITVADVVRVVDLILNLSRSAVIPNIVVNRVGASPYHA